MLYERIRLLQLDFDFPQGSKTGVGLRRYLVKLFRRILIVVVLLPDPLAQRDNITTPKPGSGTISQ